MSNKRIESLDLFRGAAAIAVVLYHFRRYLSIPQIEFAFVAVDLFFVLSGIVLAMKYADDIAAGMTFADFAFARLQRLYPMVFIAGTFATVLNLLRVPSGTYVTASSDAVWHLFALWPEGGDERAGSAFPPDGPAWSLWAELAVNAIWFPIVKYRRHGMTVIGPVAVAAAVFLAWRMQTLDYGFEAGISGRLHALVRALAGFSIGYLIGRAQVRRAPSVPVSLAIFAAVTLAFVSTHHEGWRSSVVIVAAGSLLLHSLFSSGRIWAPLAGLAHTLGLVSYPLYLIHAPAGRLLPQSGGAGRNWLMLILIVGGAAAIATLTNEFLVNWVRRFVRKRRRSAATSKSMIGGQSSVNNSSRQTRSPN